MITRWRRREEGGRKGGGAGGGKTVNPFATLITSYDDGVEKEGGSKREGGG